jgi:hypothetical protein
MYSVNACKDLSRYPDCPTSPRHHYTTFFHNGVVEIVLALLAVTSLAASQDSSGVTEHGTIAVVKFLPGQLIVAVDSIIVRTGTERLSASKGCKVVGLGERGVFLSAGIEAVEGDFISTDLAQEAFRTPGVITISKAMGGVAHKWGTLITGHLNRSKFPVLTEVQESSTKTVGLFGFEDGTGRIHLYEVDVAVLGQGQSRRAIFKVEEKQPDPDTAEELGTPHYVALMGEILANQTQRAKLVNNRLSKNTAEGDKEPSYIAIVLDAVIEWSPGALDIAAPIDVAVLEPGKNLRWFRRKAGCEVKDH